jgi:hypothetical protein
MVTPYINLFVLHVQVSLHDVTPWPTPDLVAPWPMSSQQHHRQQDSTAMSRYDQCRLSSVTVNVASAAPSSTWLRGLSHTSLTNNLPQRFTADQALGHEEYHSNWQPDSGALLSTSLAWTRGERIITVMIWDTSPNQLSHFLSCILFWVNMFDLLSTG